MVWMAVMTKWAGRSACGLVLFGALFVTPFVRASEDESQPAPESASSTSDVDARVQAAVESITPDRVQKLVDVLASDEMNGRYYLSEDGMRAARYIAKAFKESGLEPAGKSRSFYQGIGVKDASPNVVGIRRGTGKGHILLTAHYDHLKPKTSGADRIYNGADDNAGGVAALIEMARALDEIEVAPRYSILFIAFTAEEYGMKGSKYYVEHPLFPLDSARAILNLDMICRGEPDLLFVEGGRMFPELAEAIRRANANPAVALDVHFDEHPRWLYMSDQRPFVMKKIPSLYLGVDFHEDTHKVTDEADRILPGLAAKTARLALLAALELGEMDAEKRTTSGGRRDL